MLINVGVIFGNFQFFDDIFDVGSKKFGFF